MKDAIRSFRPKLRLAIFALVILVVGSQLSHSAVNPNLKMGNPSNASTSNKNNYLMVKRYFALSYNDRKGTPNWVSWRLTAGNIGSVPRAEFRPDSSLPRGFKHVTPSDYSRSGFDRGHMCPHSDRSANDTMSRSTFLMTNIIPQSPAVNQQAWERLESYCRSLAEQGKTLYMIDGPYGVGGTGRYGTAKEIGRTNRVTVPSKCWKVIMVLNPGSGDDISKINRTTRLIAVIMPNDMTVGDDWAKYRVSVASVEQLTGYRFFSNAPAAVMNSLKSKVDRTSIPNSELER